ncbi:TIGR04211 family SH3 domain-containing protein [Povalibacter sp.]|uniref:TIGR04211 family SH3 domain-containing protein n=1 Tax=Povalibacter sp. TaxID=1962978 RepID=UPI002F3F9AAC
MSLRAHRISAGHVSLGRHCSGCAEPQPGAEQAQTSELPRRYVSDKLVLTVYAEPEPASARVATIETGDAVDAIANSGSYMHVRLEDGREGWVGASYLTSEMPASARLRELQNRQKDAGTSAEKKAVDEIARLKNEAAALQSQLNQLQAATVTAAAASEVAPAQAKIAPQVASENQGERQPRTERRENRWNTVWNRSFAFVLAIGVGFTAGYQSLARRIRKRYGGLKIY